MRTCPLSLKTRRELNVNLPEIYSTIDVKAQRSIKLACLLEAASFLKGIRVHKIYTG